jgi:GTP diphosphokinase / guanosine-3',5'-bis(diphosphate) 3'-diphosphatase
MTHRKGELLSKMLVLMTNAHDGQLDKGGKPYALHPLRVMAFLNTDDEELQCIALGHDVIEDTGITYQDLPEAGMTDRIIAGIRPLTKVPGQTYEEYKAGVFGNYDSIRVKMADIRDNTDVTRLKGVTEKDLARMARYHQFYAELRDRAVAAQKDAYQSWLED